MGDERVAYACKRLRLHCAKDLGTTEKGPGTMLGYDSGLFISALKRMPVPVLLLQLYTHAKWSEIICLVSMPNGLHRRITVTDLKLAINDEELGRLDSFSESTRPPHRPPNKMPEGR